MPIVSQELSIEFEVFCNRCGAGLCGQSTVDNRNRCHVEPCEKCLQVAYDEGYEKGIDEEKEREK